LAAEFGPEQVRVALTAEAEQRGWHQPLLAELTLAEARQRRFDTRLLGLVPDGTGLAWALVTSHVTLARQAPLLVRALGAVLLARPHRPPVLSATLITDQARWLADDANWVADGPLRAASILITEDFASAAPTIMAA
jgi:hypothetical protein